MADPFAAALAALFAAPGSDGAIYTGLDGVAADIRVILAAPDSLQQFGEGQIILATNVVQLMRSQVPDPAAGETIDIVRDGVTVKSLVLSGEPMLDGEELSWRMGAEPAE